MMTIQQRLKIRLRRLGWFWALALASAVASAQMTSPIRLPKPAAPLSASAAAEPTSAPEPAPSSTAVKSPPSPEPPSSSASAKPPPAPESLSSSSDASAASPSGGSAEVKRVTVADIGIEVLQVLFEHGLAPELSEAEQDEFVRQLLALTGTRRFWKIRSQRSSARGKPGRRLQEKPDRGENDFVLLQVWQVDAACVEQLQQRQQEVRQAKNKGVVLSLLGAVALTCGSGRVLPPLSRR